MKRGVVRKLLDKVLGLGKEGQLEFIRGIVGRCDYLDRLLLRIVGDLNYGVVYYGSLDEGGLLRERYWDVRDSREAIDKLLEEFDQIQWWLLENVERAKIARVMYEGGDVDAYLRSEREGIGLFPTLSDFVLEDFGEGSDGGGEAVTIEASVMYEGDDKKD